MKHPDRPPPRFLALLVGLFAAAFSVAAPEVSLALLKDRGDQALEEDYRVLTDVAYGPHGRQLMDLYLAKDMERLGSRNLTIVFLHGGGFSFGGKAQNQRFISPFLRKGLNVVNVSYRTREGIAVATEDLTLALNHLRRRKEDYRLRLDQVVVGGFSAGGQIASTVAFSQRAPGYPFRLDDGIRIVGVINIAGPVDRLEMVEKIFAGSDREDFQLIARNMFPSGSPFSRDETLRLFTPMTHFNDEVPAYLLWHGGEDDQIPPATYARFLEALARSQVPHRVLFGPKWRHSPDQAQLDELSVEVFRFLDEIR
jgi:acetyl esterase/lipase